MSKKVLILSASPRRGGNSDLLCDQFMRGAQESGNQVEKVFLRDKEINFCLACDACRGNEGNCVQQDDMAEILNKMIAADVIVMATPVYFYTLSGQMKTLIDRTYSRYLEMSNKEIYLIMTAAASKQATEKTLEGFRAFTSLLRGAKKRHYLWNWRLECGGHQRKRSNEAGV